MIALWRRDDWIRPASGLDECGDRLDRALIAIGVDARVVASVRTDLTDEFEERLGRDGILAAQAWYVCEGVRSLLALAHYAVMRSRRNRHLVTAAVLLASATTALVIRAQPGAPDRLLLGAPTLDGAFVINAAHGGQMPIRVMDARGHQLAARGMQFHLREGKNVSVSPSGQVSCYANANAVAAVSLDDVATTFPLACRPVRALRVNTSLSVIAGGDARPLPFSAVGTNGRPVLQVRGSMDVEDTSIATVAGGRVRAKRAGETVVDVYVGAQAARVRVAAHEMVSRFTRSPGDSRFQAVPVSLIAGESRQWPLPTGALWLKYIPRTGGAISPTIEVHGPVHCMSLFAKRAGGIAADEHEIHCVVTDRGARAVVRARDAANGALALEWESGPHLLP
ncbi:MAG: hypothetical protein ACREN6_04205 [Gemmatimonadaceae bacterium]